MLQYFVQNLFDKNSIIECELMVYYLDYIVHVAL